MTEQKGIGRIPEFTCPNDKPSVIIMAYFDVLGFSNLVRNTRLEKLLEIYERLREKVKTAAGSIGFKEPLRHFDSVFGTNFSNKVDSWAWMLLEVNTSIISDSIMLWSRFHPPAMDAFLEICCAFFCEALKIGIPIRGCISFGEAIFDTKKQIFIGLPLVECVNGEKVQNWIGCGFHHPKMIDLKDIAENKPNEDVWGWNMPGSPYVFPYCYLNIKTKIMDGIIDKYAVKERPADDDSKYFCVMKSDDEKTKYYVHINNIPLEPFVLDWARYWREHDFGDIIEIVSGIYEKTAAEDERLLPYYQEAVRFYKISQREEKDLPRRPRTDYSDGSGAAVILYPLKKTE